MKSVAEIERGKADEAVREAERHLRVAQRARILVNGAIQTGVMVAQNPGGPRIEQRAEFPYVFSQAWSLAYRLTR